MRPLYTERPEFLVPAPAGIRDVGVLVEPLTIIEKAVAEIDVIQKRLYWEPQTAVVLREGFAYAFRLDGADRVAQAKVTLGRRLGERVEIVSGLAADARVVENGAGFLADGDAVKVVEGSKP
jgi:multidrug efflux pump subunit AcrA (membrane-fusion protein)